MDDKGGTLPQAGMVAEVADGATSCLHRPASWGLASQVGSGCELSELTVPGTHFQAHSKPQKRASPHCPLPLALGLCGHLLWSQQKRAFFRRDLPSLFHQDHQLVQKFLRLDELQDLRGMEVYSLITLQHVQSLQATLALWHLTSAV